MFDRASLAEQVEEALRREITEGRVRPDARVNIAEYGESWSVSSTPLRDAVRALEAQGFLRIEPRKGVFVAPMTRRSVREIFELRVALECMAVELATPRAPEAQIGAVLAAYRRLADGPAGRIEACSEAEDMAIHDLAREQCGNPRLQRLLSGQMDLVRWAQGVLVREAPRAYALALPEHIAIAEAMARRDAAGAVAAMRRHLENSRARLEARLPEDIGAEGAA